MKKMRQAFLNEALSWQGVRFQHRGKVAAEGVDCIGLILGVYDSLFPKCSVSLPDYGKPCSPMAHFGCSIDFLDELLERKDETPVKAGDVIRFELIKDSFWHFGIYAGCQRLLHAHRKRGVELTEYNRFWIARKDAVYGLKEA